MIKHLLKESNLDLKVIEASNAPQSQNKLEQAREHASNHAEMKALKHCKDSNETPDQMGVSKPPCNNCNEQLTCNGVKTREKANNKVTNWEQGGNVEVVAVQKQPKVKVNVSKFINSLRIFNFISIKALKS